MLYNIILCCMILYYVVYYHIMLYNIISYRFFTVRLQRTLLSHSYSQNCIDYSEPSYSSLLSWREIWINLWSYSVVLTSDGGGANVLETLNSCTLVSVLIIAIHVLSFEMWQSAFTFVFLSFLQLQVAKS